MFKRFISLLRGYLDGFGSEPTVIICGASALLIVSHYQGSTGFYREILGNRLDGLTWSNSVGHLWWFASSVVLYLIMPLLLAVATRGSFFRNYGMGLGDWRAGVPLTLFFLVIMLPATWYASTLPSFKGIYPLAGTSAYTLTVAGKNVTSGKLFLIYELGYLSYFIGWEFLFRGWMLNGLLGHFGKVGAVLVQVAPFAVMHLGKAEIEALGSIVAGVALGVLALRTRSFWYGAVLHGAVALWMDFLATRTVWFPPS